jgi:hypothetical protein
MGRLDKSYVHNAGLRDPAKPRVTFYKGERRQQLWPSGTVERFVNLYGTVTQNMLVPPGIPATPDAVAAARARLRTAKTRDGQVQAFIEHGRCPLLHGAREISDITREEFAKMPQKLQAPCEHDPVTFKRTKKGIEYFDGCPHVQWLIEHRRALQNERVRARSMRSKTIHEMEQEKVDLLKQQAEATTKILERVADKLDKPKKATIE